MVKNIFSRYTKYNLNNLEILGTKEYNYRNKVTFHINKDTLGYYEKQSNLLVPIDKCKLLDKSIINISASLISFIKVHKKLKKAVLKSFDNKIMLILEGNESKEEVKTLKKI